MKQYYGIESIAFHGLFSNSTHNARKVSLGNVCKFVRSLSVFVKFYASIVTSKFKSIDRHSLIWKRLRSCLNLDRFRTHFTFNLVILLSMIVAAEKLTDR